MCVVSTRLVENAPKDFADQFALFSTHGIIVAPHGAGLTNTMFLPPGSAVIEMFPYHMHHTLYTGIAFNTGVVSFPIHASNGTIIWRRDPVGSLDIPVAVALCSTVLVDSQLCAHGSLHLRSRTSSTTAMKWLESRSTTSLGTAAVTR